MLLVTCVFLFYNNGYFPLQILTNPRHRFNSSSIYKNVTLVAWDPAPYTVNLYQVCFFIPKEPLSIDKSINQFQYIWNITHLSEGALQAGAAFDLGFCEC